MRVILRKYEPEAIVVGNGEGWDGRILRVDPAVARTFFPEQAGLRLSGLHALAPGASVRFGPVLDMTEIRCCAEGAAFPGLTGTAAGDTRTLAVLDRAGLCVAARLKGAQEGIIDMASPWSPFSDMHILLCVVDVDPDLDREEADLAIRLFQYRLSEHLASLLGRGGRCLEESLHWEAEADARDLPKVGAVYFIQSQGALRRTFYNGKAADGMRPTLINPLEPIAGSLCSGNYVLPSNKNCTLIHQRAPVLRALLERHGIDWHLAGVVLAGEPSSRSEKEENCAKIAALAAELGLVGVIVNQEGGGNADMDIMLACRALAGRGITPVLMVNEFAGHDGCAPPLIETTPEALHMISTGNNEYPVQLKAVDSYLGFPLDFPADQGGSGGSAALKGGISLPLCRVYASTNQLGFGHYSCETRP